MVGGAHCLQGAAVDGDTVGREFKESDIVNGGSYGEMVKEELEVSVVWVGVVDGGGEGGVVHRHGWYVAKLPITVPINLVHWWLSTNVLGGPRPHVGKRSPLVALTIVHLADAFPSLRADAAVFVLQPTRFPCWSAKEQVGLETTHSLELL
ncbi:hypothetical protein E2C01_027731 [Portunus trituberculatus]|uniref:Uncharacterized protein n=1 Tax=Portunus trituberculatus TaxID=210409 RepID=A0A5B7EMC0_PORTR|nr:hypothetical protein [Portunus trituberculatus]